MINQGYIHIVRIQIGPIFSDPSSMGDSKKDIIYFFNSRRKQCSVTSLCVYIRVKLHNTVCLAL